MISRIAWLQLAIEASGCVVRSVQASGFAARDGWLGCVAAAGCDDGASPGAVGQIQIGDLAAGTGTRFGGAPNTSSAEKSTNSLPGDWADSSVRRTNRTLCAAAGTIVRTHVLRPTWHFVAAEDLRWMLALSAPRIAAARPAARAARSGEQEPS